MFAERPGAAGPVGAGSARRSVSSPPLSSRRLPDSAPAARSDWNRSSCQWRSRGSPSTTILTTIVACSGSFVAVRGSSNCVPSCTNAWQRTAWNPRPTLGVKGPRPPCRRASARLRCLIRRPPRGATTVAKQCRSRSSVTDSRRPSSPVTCGDGHWRTYANPSQPPWQCGDRPVRGVLSAALVVGELDVLGLAGVGPLRGVVVMPSRGLRAIGRRCAWWCRAGQRCPG